MSKLHNDIRRLFGILNIIEQYNNFRQLGATEDIIFLREKVTNLYSIKDTQELIKEFNWCCKMCNMYYDEIDPSFKKFALEEQRNSL